MMIFLLICNGILAFIFLNIFLWKRSSYVSRKHKQKTWPIHFWSISPDDFYHFIKILFYLCFYLLLYDSLLREINANFLKSTFSMWNRVKSCLPTLYLKILCRFPWNLPQKNNNNCSINSAKGQIKSLR